ncbi:MAG: 50S ribosomal protein L6 [Minisyncoccia bacterium]|jgi:large subunit ribosomal protein L6
MSKIGKQPIKIPAGVTVTIEGKEIKIKGPKEEIILPVLPGVEGVLENGELKFSAKNDSKQARSNWGTQRALVSNAVTGLVKDFEKTLILEGVGYRVAKEGENLSLNIGFSHPVKYEAPKGITFEVEKNSILKVRGANKSLVGHVAAEIRALRKPEPYKGKGFHYSNEVVRRKAGKKAATTAAVS